MGGESGASTEQKRYDMGAERGESDWSKVDKETQALKPSNLLGTPSYTR